MENKPILIVDDEKNIRFTLSQALEDMTLLVHTAVNGEEALQKLEREPFGLVFLDLKMPGMDGMTALRQIKARWPSTRVIIITAHGTIQTAVEAMKLGAVDFIQKPFSPSEIREITTRVLARETLDESSATDYRAWIELSKRHISDRNFPLAREAVRKAISVDPSEPEAYNLLGALLEIKGEWVEAQKFYRAALDIDPTFKPAAANLERSTSWQKTGGIDFGLTQAQPEMQAENTTETGHEKP